MSLRHDSSGTLDAQPKAINMLALSECVLLALSVVGSVSILIWILFYSRYGYDFTDEGYYLNWVVSPGLYDWSLSQFGFIYHPFSLLLNGSVSALRMFNVLTTFVLGWLLVDIIIRDAFSKEIQAKIKRIIISFGFGTGVLVFFSVWLPSPGYNSLNLQAFLVAASGLFLAQSKIDKNSIVGWILIGVGGWLAFMAKPSSAAALGCCVFVCLLLSKKLNYKLIALCGLFVALMLFLSAFIIDGSIAAFIERLQAATVFVGYLGGGHTIQQLIRVDSFLLSEEDILFFCISLFVSVMVALLLYFDNRFSRILGLGCATVTLLFILSMLIGEYIVPLKYSNFHGLLILVVPSSIFLSAIFFSRQKFFSEFSFSSFSIALVLAFFPHMYAFGTNNNYWQAGSLAGFFWILSALVLWGHAVRGSKVSIVLLPSVLLTQLVVVLIIQAGMESPYRQIQPLRLNTQTVVLGASESTLLLSNGYAAYLKQDSISSKKAGFQPGMPVIDLTGQSPGVLYALAASSIGQAWIIGGYPGSFKLATEALKRVSCEDLSSAWLLLEPGGPRSISDSLVTSFGALPSDYEEVATWSTASGAGGYEQRPDQKLMKPTRDIKTSIEGCNESRR